jgi:hypothetical protein
MLLRFHPDAALAIAVEVDGEQHRGGLVKGLFSAVTGVVQSKRKPRREK